MKASNFIFAAVLVVAVAIGISAQTSAFTYQGRFTDGGTAANGTYEMQFKLFDGASNQVGSTVTNAAVVVSDGVFTVQLDYGAAAFPGADRFLEIGVRLAGSGDPYTVLAPRQSLTSSPYAIRAGSTTTADTAATATTATNATQLGGVAANQYVQTNDPRLTDARVPAAGSSNYIQNTNSQQAANFDISGNGTAGGTLSANVVNAATQYNIGGKHAFSTDFYGTYAGGSVGTQGDGSSFFGASAGAANTFNGQHNSFFGAFSGMANTTGLQNSFFGTSSGIANTTGTSNVFVGDYVAVTNTTGQANTIVGALADTATANLSNATAIGYGAEVSQSNSLVLGSIKNVGNGSADTNVGIGTTAPNARFHIAVNGGNVLIGNAGCGSGFTGIGFGASLTGCANYSLLGNGTDTIVNRPSGGGLFLRENNVTQMMIATGGAVTVNSTLVVGTLGAAGSTSLCRNASNQISTCSSSLRYKTNIQPFIGGLEVVNRLHPITFDWKQGGMHDLGFGAEDIAALEPLLVTHNDKGEVEGVKYDRITAVLVNAVKEQQEEIKQQRTQIEMLKTLVCRRNRRTPVCK